MTLTLEDNSGIESTKLNRARSFSHCQQHSVPFPSPDLELGRNERMGLPSNIPSKIVQAKRERLILAPSAWLGRGVIYLEVGLGE